MAPSAPHGDRGDGAHQRLVAGVEAGGAVGHGRRREALVERMAAADHIGNDLMGGHSRAQTGHRGDGRLALGLRRTRRTGAPALRLAGGPPHRLTILNRIETTITRPSLRQSG